MDTKAEIKEIFVKYKNIIKDINFSDDIEFKMILKKIEEHIPAEKPDGYLEVNETIYGIEHFQISQYVVKKGQDFSRVAKGSQNNREKMQKDRDFSLKPSVDNLISALERNIDSHSHSFEEYKENVLKRSEKNTVNYKLIIFIEDSTDSGTIVKRRDTKPINPLELRQLAEIILKYKDDIWAVIYSFGNEITRELTGCTVQELQDKKEAGLLLNAEEYVPFEVDREVHVSSKDSKEDKNSITIKLFDHF